MSQLVKCTSCARHVRVGETSCPFCAATLDVAERAAIAQAVAAGLPSRRMGRAALLAIGLGVIAPLTNACSSDDDDSTDNGGDAGKNDGGFAPAYGIAVDASVDAMTGALYGAGPVNDASFSPDTGLTPAYGGASPVDASTLDSGEDADAADAGDASNH